MPGFDGTGPLGQGPMTGRGQGFCFFDIFGRKPRPNSRYCGIKSCACRTSK